MELWVEVEWWKECNKDDVEVQRIREGNAVYMRSDNERSRV
jgi:hypothetical protein